MTNFKRLAFTLAEILIVIGIIGIVAEMVIPSLISNVQVQTTITLLQKAYNETSSAINQIATDGGCIDDLGCSGIFAAGTDNTSFGQAFTKYFKVARDCGINSANGKCWADQTNNNYDGSSASNTYFNTNGYYTFLTADGMSFALNNSSTASGCSTSYCGFIVVDINSNKGPNTLGRDTFFFLPYTKASPGSNNRLLRAYGERGTLPWNLGGANHCSTTDPIGYFCAGRIIEKGWVIDY